MSVFAATQFFILGWRTFTNTGYFKAAKLWDNSVLPRDLKGKYCMVTGANQGLGFQTAKELAQRGWGCTLYLVCRNKERGNEAVEQIKQDTGNSSVHLLVCDVSSMQSIKDLATDYKGSGKPLHVLVNNAGFIAPERKLTVEGLESSFATNTMGAFLLTRELEGVLKSSAPARVIFVSSGGMYNDSLCMDDLQAANMKKFDGVLQYARDKRRMVAYTEAFAKRWQGSDVGAYSMHPGWTITEGVKTSLPGFTKLVNKRFRTLEQGADTTVWLALEDMDKLQPGAFYLDRKPAAKNLSWASTAYTDADVDKLWDQLNAIADAKAG